MKKINSIYFVKTKKNHTAAVINNSYTVVKDSQKNEYNIYNNVAGGLTIESNEDIINEFSNAFKNHFEKIEEENERLRKIEEEKERNRISTIKETVKGMTPEEFADFYQMDCAETASHWSQTYNGTSSVAIKICKNEELELVEIASEVNNWGGEFGELKRRDGEHHSEFNWFYDIKEYRTNIQDHFSDKYFFKSKETEEEYFLEKIKEAESIDEVKDLMNEFEKIEDGYYTCGGTLVYSGDDFSNFFGYHYDVYTYTFGYKLPSRRIFENGIEEDEGEN